MTEGLGVRGGEDEDGVSVCPPPLPGYPAPSQEQTPAARAPSVPGFVNEGRLGFVLLFLLIAFAPGASVFSAECPLLLSS